MWGEELQAVVLGPGGERLLLKEKRAYLSDAELQLHLDLHRFVAERGAPVAPFPPAFAGRLPLCLGGDRLIEVQTWIAGSKVDPESPRELAEAGLALARFHQAAVGFSWPDAPSLHQEPRERFGKAGFYRPLLAAALEDSEHPLLEGLYAALESARRSLEGLEEPRQPLHGDPAPDNFLLGEKGCLLIDLDDAHLGPPSEDLAWLITMCGALLWAPEGACLGVREAWALELMQAALEGYRRGWGGRGVEAGRLPPWLVASLVCGVVDCLTDEGGPIIPRDELEEHCRRALHLIGQVKDLIS